MAQKFSEFGFQEYKSLQCPVADDSCDRCLNKLLHLSLAAQVINLLSSSCGGNCKTICSFIKITSAQTAYIDNVEVLRRKLAI